MKLGANSVLFGGHSMEAAFRYIAMAGYDGIELSAIEGMSEHLLSRWRELARRSSAFRGRPGAAGDGAALAGPERMEQASRQRWRLAFPSSTAAGRDDGRQASLQERSILLVACHHGRSAASPSVEGHVGAAIYNTPTTLRVMEAIQSPAFGIDMDPSHIYRAGENPVEAIAAVVSRVKHIHIRDCKGRQQSPGKPEMQANGRGDIDLLGYIRVLHENGYTGPVNLEVIGAKEYSLEQCCIIAAESRGHMQACLQACGAR